MWVSTVNRKQLLEVFELADTMSPPVSVSKREHVPSIFRPGEHLLIWKRDPKLQPQLPVALLLPEQTTSDFLAWASTYLPSVRPFTAFCRVTENQDVFEELTEHFNSQEFDQARLGLILGEAVLSRNSELHSKLSLFDCLSTYSFVMARSWTFDRWDTYAHVSDRWFSLKRLLRATEPLVDLQSLESIWVILMAVSSRGVNSLLPIPRLSSDRKISRDLIEVVWTLCMNGKLEYRDWILASALFPEVSGAFDETRGTREERVRSIDKALVTLSTLVSRDPLTANFIAGYLTSQVSPGTFDHFALLLPYRSSLSSAMLWYGLSAGLYKDAQLKKSFAGLGHRVWREIARIESTLDRPRCDISIDELEIWNRGENNTLTDIPSNTPGVFQIEIAPLVNTWVKSPDKILINGSNSSTLSVDSQQEVRALISDLGQLVGRVENLRQRLSTLLNVPKPSESAYTKKRKR